VAAAEPKTGVRGEITEIVTESTKVDGGLFVGVILGDLPQKFPSAGIRVVSHDASSQPRCLQLATSDGVYSASGIVFIDGSGLVALALSGFSRYPKVLNSYPGENVSGMLTRRHDCHSNTPYSYIEPLYFRGDKRRIHVAINGGGAAKIELVATTGQGKLDAACRRVVGRTVAFNFWCEFKAEPSPEPIHLQLRRSIGDSPPRTDTVVLRLPAK